MSAAASSPSGADTGAKPARVRFTETMKGHVTFGEQDFTRGHRRGRESGTRLAFRLTIEVPDIDRFLSDPMREAVATGAIRCHDLGGERPVENGVFNLFVDTERAGEKRMLYRLHFRDGVGHPLTLTGHKVIADGPGLDLWSDTTTLFTRLVKGHARPNEDESAEVVASGVLRISPLAFARQLSTFRGTGPSAVAGARALIRFNSLFLGELWRIYGIRPGKWRR